MSVSLKFAGGYIYSFLKGSAMSSGVRSYLKYMALGCFGTFLVLIVIGLALFFGGKYALDYAMEQFADENPTAFSE